MNQRTDDIINRTVIMNRLDSITSEMGIALERSAHSPIFAEACDFACCICDAPAGSELKDATAAIADGTLPGISIVMIDGEVVAQGARVNTAPAKNKVCA